MKKKIPYIILIFILLIIIILNQHQIINLLKDIYHSFYRTIIEENRYLLIIKGLNSTLIISLFSCLIGTILGFIIFLIRKSKIKLLGHISQIFVSLIQGTPMTVLLLIAYYVIFGSISINPILVAILSFAIYFSAYVSEIFRGAYLSINRNQIFSAYALGFTKIQTIKYIILPQVLTYMIPVFKNEMVSLIKSTSIAGYISIMDLTKASDIIRNRTYEAFFPLIFTALIYFIICFILSIILDAIYKKINPRKARSV